MGPTSREATEPLHHIVAATDFSTPAAIGVSWARDLARAHGASLHLAHAVYQIEPGLVGTEPPFDLTEEALKAARERLDEQVSELAEVGVTVASRADFGQPSQVVLREAKECGADLVVIATRGLGGFRHLLLGSTAERIVQRSEIPVLAVHGGDTDGGAAAVRTVVLPTDFSEDARGALDAAVRIFRLGPEATVHLLHVVHLPPEYQVYRADGLSGMSRGLVERSMEIAEEDLAVLTRELEGNGLTVRPEVVEGDPAEVIIRRAEELGADLIAMGTHGAGALERLFLGSVARRVVQHGPCPVLTVRHRL